MDCSLPGSSVHGISQARTLEWVVIPPPTDLPNLGTEHRSPALQVLHCLSHQGSHKWTCYCSNCLAHNLEKVMAPHSSTLAWKIPWTEEPGRLQSMGSLGSDTTERLPFHFSLSCIGEGNGNPQPTPVFLPGESQGRGESDGLLSMGSHRVGHDCSDLAAAAAVHN